MTRSARRAVAAGLGVAILLAAGCSGDDGDRVATAPSTSSSSSSTAGGTATSTSGPTSTSAGTASSAPGTIGPGPLVPGAGQSWTDLYPNGQPPVFPLPNSSRSFPAAQAAAIGFGRDFLGMEDPQVSVASESENDAELLVRADTAGEASRLTLRRDGQGWVVVRVDGQGISTGLPPTGGAQQPAGVSRTIDLTGASPAGAAVVDVVDLADGRVLARTAAGSGSVRLDDPLPQLAAVVVYLPNGSATSDLASPRQAEVASVTAVQVRPG